MRAASPTRSFRSRSYMAMARPLWFWCARPTKAHPAVSIQEEIGRALVQTRSTRYITAMDRQARRKRGKRIVVIGGGTGIFPVLTGLRSAGHHLSAVVTMADDGGSSGVLREEFGILPPGVVR